MRKLSFVFFLPAALCFCAYAQERGAPSCPAISVIGPSSAIRPGDEMIFAANISNVEPDQAGYVWTITGGQIKRGQGTPVIYVSTAAAGGRSITAKVEIKNLPEHCPNSASETGNIATVDPPKLDEYGKLTFREEKQKLDEAVEEMKNLNGAQLVIIKFYPKSVSPQVRKKRASDIQNYLTTVHRVPKKSVRVVYGGEGNGRHFTSIYLIPPGP